MRKKNKKLIIIGSLISFLFLLILVILLSIYYNNLSSYQQTQIYNESTENKNETKGFIQENISIEVPEGVVKVGKGGRIKVIK